MGKKQKYNLSAFDEEVQVDLTSFDEEVKKKVGDEDSPSLEESTISAEKVEVETPDEKYTTEDIALFDTIDAKPRKLMGLDEATRQKYTDYKKEKATKYEVTPEEREEAKQAINLLDDYLEETDTKLKETDTKEKAPWWAIPEGGTATGAPRATFEVGGEAEAGRNLVTQKRLIGEAKRYFNAVSEGDKQSGVERFWEGVKTLDVPNAISFGIKDMLEGIDVAQIGVKAQEEGVESLTQEEKDVLVLNNIRNYAQQAAQEDRAFAVGSGIAETVPFIADMIITSGIGAGIRKGVTGASKNAIRRLTGHLTDATTRAFLFPSTYEETARRMTPETGFDEEGELVLTEKGESVTEALPKAVGTNAVEIFSEVAIGQGLQKLVRKAARKGVPLLKNTKVGQVFKAVDDATTNSPVLKMAAIQDPITEFGEEVFAGVVQPIITGDGSPLDFFERENMIRTAMITSIMTTAMSTPSAAMGVRRLMKENKGKEIYEDLSEENKARFDAATESDNFDDGVKQMVEINDAVSIEEARNDNGEVDLDKLMNANKDFARLVDYYASVKKAENEAKKIKGASYQLGNRVYQSKKRFLEEADKAIQKGKAMPVVKINNDKEAQKEFDNVYGTVEKETIEEVIEPEEKVETKKEEDALRKEKLRKGEEVVKGEEVRTQKEEVLKPTEAPQKTTEEVSVEKEVKVPEKEKVAEKGKKESWEMTQDEFVAQGKDKTKKLGRKSFTLNGIKVYQNPTSDDYAQVKKDARGKYPRGARVETRFTVDAYGNRFIWDAYDGTHSQVEPLINKRTGRDVSQHGDATFSSMEHRNKVYKAFMEGKPVPDDILNEYPEFKDIPEFKEKQAKATKIKEDEVKREKVEIDEADTVERRRVEQVKQEKVKAERKKRFDEIDAELGAELENLAEAIGVTKKLTGEQRAKIAPTVARVTKLLAEKTALKGQELVDEVIEYFKGKNVVLDDELISGIQGDVSKVGVKETEVTIEKESTQKEEKVKQFGKKVTESTKLSTGVKQAVRKAGIGYVPRGRKVTESEAKELIRIYSEEGGMDRVKSEILDRTNKIQGDTRVAMAVAYTQRMLDDANKELDPQRAARMREDATDIFNNYVEETTGVAQELQAQRLWQKVLGTHPDFIVQTARKMVDDNNREFYEKHDKDIKSAQKVIEDFLESDTFKEKYAKKKPRKESASVRMERGKAKVSDALDRLATLRGVRKGLLAENEIKDNELKVLVDMADGLLDIGVASVEDLMNALKVQVRSYFTPSEIDRVKNKIVKQTKAQDRLDKKTRKVKLDKKDEQQLVDELFAKMNIATKSQLRQLIADNMELFEKEGAINDRSFRELVAKALGKDFIDDAQMAALEDAARKINDVSKIEENIDSLFDEYSKAVEEKQGKKVIDKLKKEVKNQVKEHKKALLKAGVASNIINDVFAESPTAIKLLANNIQGNLLTPASLKVNIVANALVAPIRAAKNATAIPLDYMLSTIGRARKRMQKKNNRIRDPYLQDVLDKMFAEERTFMSTGINKGLIRGAMQGTEEGVRQMWYGQMPDDVYRRDLNKALHPFEAWYDMYQSLKGEEKLRATEMLNKFIEGTLSVPPEIMFRFLNLGDKPFRRAAEQSRLEELAKIKGLTGVAKERFLTRPDDESREEARQAGLRATYQQDNFLSEGLRALSDTVARKAKTDIDFIDKMLSSLGRLGFVSQMPYIKTPTNILIETLEYVMPVIPMIRAVGQAAKGNRRGFVDNMAKMITGIMINEAVGTLFGYGMLSLVSGGEEEEPRERTPQNVRAAEYRNLPQYYANTRALNDLMRNIVFRESNDLARKEGDRMSSYTRFGLISAILMAHAEGYKGLSDEEIKKLSFARRQMLFTMPAVRSSLDQSFVSGISSGINAIQGGEYEQEAWLMNTARAMSATAIPNTFRAYNQAADNYIRETKDRSFKGYERIKDRIKSDMKASYTLDNGLPAKVTVWGEKVERYKDGKHPLFRVFDITKTRDYNSDFGAKLFELYERTGDNSVLLTPINDNVRFMGENVKMDKHLHERMQIDVGTKYKQTVRSHVESNLFRSLTDTEKINYINALYAGKEDIALTRNDLKRKFIYENRTEFEELFRKQFGDEKYYEEKQKGVKSE